MSEHTPGPWEVRGGYEEVYGPAIYTPDAHETLPLAAVDSTDPNAEANARLIAAAPDLLAALERLLDNGEDPHPLSGRDPTIRREDVGPARAAIAKATGT